jgi:hypothetical protein
MITTIEILEEKDTTLTNHIRNLIEMIEITDINLIPIREKKLVSKAQEHQVRNLTKETITIYLRTLQGNNLLRILDHRHAQNIRN